MAEPICSSGEAEGKASTPRTASEWIHALYPLILALFFSFAVLFLLGRFRARVEELEAYGYLGVFIVGFLANATIILPAPSLIVTTAVGGILNPIIVGLVAGAGEALGEMTGYLGGISGKRIIESRSRYEVIQRYMKRYGDWVYFVLAVIPNPLFDVAGLAAGVMRYPVWRFLLFVWLGKTVKALFFAQAGHQLFN